MWQGWESFLRFCNIRKHSLGTRINALVEETPESSLTPSTRWPSMSQKTGWAKKQISGHWICWHFYHGLESLAEKAMAPHSSTLAWKIPWTEEPGGLQSMGFLRVGHDWATSLSLSWIGEGNGNPLQCSCLENPRDGRAWWAAVYGVTQSRTRLKRLSSSSSRVSRTLRYEFLLLINHPFHGFLL